MEVTCERCSTVYDFDDALVSERGTTVKCTTCSHQFKVRRAAPTTGPDVWIVRTVDGREIEFAALRDLQAAIYDNRVTREDVLVRGTSRPRRLGSIAELEPFFNRAAPNPPRRARTLAGAGASTVPAVSAQRNETSVVFSLPNLMRSNVEQDGPVSVRRSTLPPPPPMPIQSASKRDGSQPPARRTSMPPATPRSGADLSPPPYRRGSIPPPPTETAARRAGSSPAISSNPGGWFGIASATEPEEEWSSTGIERVSALPPPPLPPRRSVPPPPPMFPAAEPPPPPAETVKAPRMFPDPEPTKISKPPTPPSTAPEPIVVAATNTSDKPEVSASVERISDANNKERTSTSSADKLDVTETNTNDDAATEAAASGETVERSSKPSSVETTMKSAGSERPSSPMSTPLPSSRRNSDPHSGPRHSGPLINPRAGAARWIVGFVLIGCGALATVTLGPKITGKPLTGSSQPDARVSGLLDQGDRAMNEGDLDAANEAYVKASALADKDGRIDLRLARLAVIRADVPWLKVRLLSESDPDLANARRELVLAAARAHQAAERAQEVLPNEPDVTRCRIDALRLQGNVAEARKLVASLLKPTGVSNDEVVFALLDLAEPTPTWPSVIERLSNAARNEQNLGHARSMLIYALVQSGDIARAKSELEQLVAMPRPHPLIGAFRTFISHAEKEPAAAGSEEAGAPVDDASLLQAAKEATASGNVEKAAEILKDLETRLPSDANVLTALGKLALKKKERAAAAKYFDRAIAADKNQFDAMSALADIKWDSGEKQGASILYRQIIERAGADSPHMAQAKERFTAFADGIADESSN